MDFVQEKSEQNLFYVAESSSSTAWRRWLQLCAPRANPRHVFPIGTNTHTHTYTAPIHINTLPATQLNLGRNHSTRTSTNGLILFPSLADSDEGLLVGKIYICIYAVGIPPVAGLRHSPLSNWPLILLALGHASSPRGPEPHARGWYRPP